MGKRATTNQNVVYSVKNSETLFLNDMSLSLLYSSDRRSEEFRSQRDLTNRPTTEDHKLFTIFRKNISQPTRKGVHHNMLQKLISSLLSFITEALSLEGASSGHLVQNFLLKRP